MNAGRQAVATTMAQMDTPHAPGQIHLDRRSQPASVRIRGDWTLARYTVLQGELAALEGQLDDSIPVDMAALGELDTAGASLLAQLLGAQRLSDWAKAQESLPAARRALLQTVGEAMQSWRAPAPVPQTGAIRAFFAHIGSAMEKVARQEWVLLGFIGLTLATLVDGLWHPRRWRLTPLVAQIEETGWNAIPIVALLTFMVGAVVAFLGSTVLAGFGAGIYTVNLVAFSFLREFGVLLTAILLAGRTASAFAAQIGSMQANEEVDAIRILGLNPVELLVLPRVLAMLIALPALTLVAMFSGLLGGGVVCAMTLDVSPMMFINMVHENVAMRHFLVGMAKAPVFAFLIAVIGCAEGFKVTGSAQSVGEHTTSSVVQSIFMVILVDALAALFFMQAGW